MTTPTFTSVTPSNGYPGGGQVVEIVGTNFRAEERPYEAPATDWPATVAVTFDGVASDNVQVASSTLLRVKVPTAEFDPNVAGLTDDSLSRIRFPSVDIAITNLDDDGVAIPGESVTASGAFIYEQPLLRIPSGTPPLTQVLYAFIRLLKRCIVSNINWDTARTYGDDGAVFTVLSKHPSIGFTIDIVDDPEYGYFDNEQQIFEVAPGVYDVYDKQMTVMMMIDLTISCHKSSGLAMRMIQALMDMQLASPNLIVPPDPRYPIAGEPNNEYPLEFTGRPSQAHSANNADIRAFTASMRIRGIPMLLDEPSTKGLRNRTTIYLGFGSFDYQTAVEI